MIAQATKEPATAEQEAEFATIIGAHLARILEHISSVAEVRAELMRRAFARKLVWIALAGVAGLALGSVALLAAWQFGRGLSQGLALLTGQPWLGDLLSGALLLACVGGAALLLLAHLGPRNEKPLEARELEAWGGLKCSLTDLGEELVRASELRERVRQHPYVSLGAGLAAGIAAAPLVQGLLNLGGPLVRGALSGLPGLGTILRRANGPRNPTSSAP